MENQQQQQQIHVDTLISNAIMTVSNCMNGLCHALRGSIEENEKLKKELEQLKVRGNKNEHNK
jgi:hypothetical protein